MVIPTICAHSRHQIQDEPRQVVALRAVASSGARTISYQDVCSGCHRKLVVQGLVLDGGQAQEAWISGQDQSPARLLASQAA